MGDVCCNRWIYVFNWVVEKDGRIIIVICIRKEFVCNLDGDWNERDDLFNSFICIVCLYWWKICWWIFNRKKECYFYICNINS